MWFYIRKRYILVLVSIAFIAALWWYSGRHSHKFTETSQARLGAPLYNNIENYHHPIHTRSPLAQRYFNQGLMCVYAHNNSEAVRSFQEAANLDPQSPMTYWGMALALGSQSNTPSKGNERREIRAAMEEAKRLSQGANPHEQAYIHALAKRYLSKYDAAAMSLSKRNDDCLNCMGCSKVTKKEAREYANAMKLVVEQFPNDIDAKLLYAAALLEAYRGDPFSDSFKHDDVVQEMILNLESAFQIDPSNLPAHHYYVQTMIYANTPERALPSADFIHGRATLMRQFAHLPAHIYIATGRYHDATIAVQRGIQCYKNYIGETWSQGFEPRRHYWALHDFHLLWVSSSLLGKSQLAIETADELGVQAQMSGLNEGRIQTFSAMPYFARVRFGQWDSVLKQQEPPEEIVYQRGMWHYARGMAFAHVDKVKKAEDELKLLKDLSEQKRIADHVGAIGVVQLNIAALVLESMIAVQNTQYDLAEKLWKRAVELEDSMNHAELSLWYFPIREGYADALMEMNRPIDAEAEYRRVLKEYPENGWSLYGLSQAIRAQGRHLEADRIHQQFKNAWSRSDNLPVQHKR